MKSADKEKHRVQKKMKVTAEEDRKLRQLVYIHGENNWEEISKRMQNRNVRQCHFFLFFTNKSIQLYHVLFTSEVNKRNQNLRNLENKN